METAAKILILAGVLNIAYGLLTGIPAGMIRQKSPAYPKYLRFVHIGALMWGPILISLALAIELSTLDEGFELLAVWFMVGSSVLLNAKDTINWLTGVKDEFAEKPRLPLALGGLSAVGSMLGISIIFIGILQGM
jgi:hypothetical protein